jgi:rRNA maturation RNase YbeY
LAGDDEIAELNHRFRGLDEATDVLSFPSDAMVKPFLGDIAISVPFAERQARERGIPLRRELAYLAIHGTLHLLGFDDQTDDDRDQMIRLMNEAALDAGIPVDSSWSSMHPEPAFAGDPR